MIAKLQEFIFKRLVRKELWNNSTAIIALAINNFVSGRSCLFVEPFGTGWRITWNVVETNKENDDAEPPSV